MAAAAGGGAVRALSQKEQDIQMMLAADVHLGTKNCDFQMERYVFKRRTDGIYIINLGKTWEKLQLAARVIVAIENPQDIIVQSARPYGQRAVLKFAQYTGAHAIAGRHTPGTFTNQLQTSFSEPRLLILTDPRTDHQPIKESALGNIRPLPSVTLTLPCVMSISASQRTTREEQHWMSVLAFGQDGSADEGHYPPWAQVGSHGMLAYDAVQNDIGDVMGPHFLVDLFFYRDPEEAKEQEGEAAVAPEFAAITDYQGADQWGGDQWTSDVPVPPVAPIGADWGAAPAPVPTGDGWDQAGAPVPVDGTVPPVIAPTGWDQAPQPTAQGWE
ncbi:unnamed protein product [Miscanthus lutarioriparius]|uniref:40S ribosomal protein SA n=1 Tax=Miscanthus lutarioriparius TaxID=422564 RepID=A0A811MQY1_9POAL|nr:unnamed protein product [Miscanthus lutarioriparius]